jgi:hypothetical protein
MPSAWVRWFRGEVIDVGRDFADAARASKAGDEGTVCPLWEKNRSELHTTCGSRNAASGERLAPDARRSSREPGWRRA